MLYFRMIFRILVFLLLILSSFLNAQTFALDEDDTKVSILEHSKMYIDTTSSMSFEEVKKKEFKSTNTNYLKLGYTPNTLWVKFSVKNDSNKKIKRYLTLTNNMLDIIELYTKQNDGTFKKETQGLLHNKSDWHKGIYLFSNFEIVFKPNESKDFYYMTHSLSSANYFKLYLKDSINLFKDELKYQLVESLFIGAMLALFIYNIFIFIFTKNKAYLYYLLYFFFITFNHASYSSMSTYFTPNEYAHIEAYLATYYIGFSNIFALLFIHNILEIKRYKKLSLTIYSLILINTILMVISLLGFNLIEYASLLIFFSMFILLFTCIYSYIKKHHQAKYILVGWSINVIGIFMLFFKDYGVWTIIDTLPYFYEVCTFSEAILFSVALASKLNKTKELENSLKTNEILTRELHHRVKNNMQFIILMYRLKLANLTNEKIDEKLKETEGSIQAMSKTHEILYNQKDLESIDTKLYFKNLIDELKRSFHTKNIKINLHIQTNLDTQQAIYCGIILNELITNSFKYAFASNKGEIEISLSKENQNHKFTINDNGIGFNYKDKSFDSFGLSFVTAMVEDELKGKIEFKNANGTKVKINF